jgi:hypothetical protein
MRHGIYCKEAYNTLTLTFRNFLPRLGSPTTFTGVAVAPNLSRNNAPYLASIYLVLLLMHLLGAADCVVASYVFVIETCVYLSIYCIYQASSRPSPAMLFDTEYTVDRLLQEQPSLGRFAGADRRVRFPSGQARRGQPFAMASIWNVDAPTDTGSTTLSVQEHQQFLRELSNTVSSALAYLVLDGGPTIQVSFLPAHGAARVGFALLTPLPWRPVRRNIDDPPPHDTSCPSTRAG